MSGSQRLGRGLAALLGDPAPAQGPRTSLPVTALEPGPFQPRTVMPPEQLQELADSIRQQGVLQPLLARPHPDTEHKYQIIAGERRWRAAQLAGLHDVPVLVRELSDSEAMAAGLVENLQRQDLNPIEEAEAYRRLLGEFGMTQDQLGGLVGKSRSHVANTMRLLQLTGRVREHLQNGVLSAGHARALLGHTRAEALAETVIQRGLNVRQTEALASRTARPPEKRQPDPELTALERELTAKTGLRVQVVVDGQGGTVRISYRTLDQLDGIITLLMRD